MEWLFKKYPRSKKTCGFCNGSYGLARPHYPFCSAHCEAWFENALFRCTPVPRIPSSERFNPFC